MEKKKRERSNKRILKTSVTLRCTQAYRDRLQEISQASGVSVGAYIRECIDLETDRELIEKARRAAKRECKKISLTEDALKVAEAAADISRVLTSIQILENAARRLSKEGILSKHVIDEIEKALFENQLCVHMVMSTLMADYRKGDLHS